MVKYLEMGDALLQEEEFSRKIGNSKLQRNFWEKMNDYEQEVWFLKGDIIQSILVVGFEYFLAFEWEKAWTFAQLEY